MRAFTCLVALLALACVCATRTHSVPLTRTLPATPLVEATETLESVAVSLLETGDDKDSSSSRPARAMASFHLTVEVPVGVSGVTVSVAVEGKAQVDENGKRHDLEGEVVVQIGWSVWDVITLHASAIGRVKMASYVHDSVYDMVAEVARHVFTSHRGAMESEMTRMFAELRTSVDSAANGVLETTKKLTVENSAFESAYSLLDDTLAMAEKGGTGTAAWLLGPDEMEQGIWTYRALPLMYKSGIVQRIMAPFTYLLQPVSAAARGVLARHGVTWDAHLGTALTGGKEGEAEQKPVGVGVLSVLVLHAEKRDVDMLRVGTHLDTQEVRGSDGLFYAQVDLCVGDRAAHPLLHVESLTSGLVSDDSHGAFTYDISALADNEVVKVSKGGVALVLRWKGMARDDVVRALGVVSESDAMRYHVSDALIVEYNTHDRAWRWGRNEHTMRNVADTASGSGSWLGALVSSDLTPHEAMLCAYLAATRMAPPNVDDRVRGVLAVLLSQDFAATVHMVAPLIRDQIDLVTQLYGALHRNNDAAFAAAMRKLRASLRTLREQAARPVTPLRTKLQALLDGKVRVFDTMLAEAEHELEGKKLAAPSQPYASKKPAVPQRLFMDVSVAFEVGADVRIEVADADVESAVGVETGSMGWLSEDTSKMKSYVGGKARAEAKGAHHVRVEVEAEWKNFKDEATVEGFILLAVPLPDSKLSEVSLATFHHLRTVVRSVLTMVDGQLEEISPSHAAKALLSAAQAGLAATSARDSIADRTEGIESHVLATAKLKRMWKAPTAAGPYTRDRSTEHATLWDLDAIVLGAIDESTLELTGDGQTRSVLGKLPVGVGVEGWWKTGMYWLVPTEDLVVDVKKAVSQSS